jgi:hypothetical protein
MRPTINNQRRGRLGRTTRTAIVFTAGVALATLAWAAPTAAAADRYASPSGAGSACTKANPCDLGVAITAAPKGSRVLVVGNQGDYLRSAPITANKAITVQGSNGRPRIVFTAGGLTLAKGGSVQNLQVEAYGDQVALALQGGADASRVFAKAGGTSHACGLLGGSTLTNVLCWADGLADKALEVKGAVTLRNATAYGGTEAALAIIGYDICRCEQFQVRLINTIVWAPASTDLYITSDLPDVTVKPTTSNYRTVNAVEEGGADVRVVKSDTNQTKAGKRPAFIDAAAGNFRAKPGSPVVDTGVTATENGTKDLDGRVRKAGQRTDIGAYEFSPPTTTITGGPSGTVSGDPAAFTFKSSRAGSTFQCRSDAAPFWTVCSTPWDIGWDPGSHTFRVRAVDSLGYIDASPATRTFKVVAP